MPDVRQSIAAIGYRQQSALGTPLVAANMVRLSKNNDGVGNVSFVDEDDSQDKGRGTPFATNVYPVSAQGNWGHDYYLTSLNAAIMGVFGIGRFAKTAAGAGWKYQCRFASNLCQDTNMPVTCTVDQICPGVSAAWDLLQMDVACEQFTVRFNDSTGRDNSQIESTWIGSGRHNRPSAIVVPALHVEHQLTSGGITTLAFDAIDYMAAGIKVFESFELTIKNNIRVNKGYPPGSGKLASGHAVMSRVLRGNPAISAKLTVLLRANSPELAAYLARTTGVFHLVSEGDVIGAGPEVHKLDFTGRSVQLANQTLGTTDGLVTVVSDMTFKDPNDGGGPIYFDVTTDQDDIGTVVP